MKNFDLWMSISGSLLIAAPIQAQKKAKEKQPNVIFIIADDLGYGDMSCYGAHRVQTPHVDTLASSGIRFTDAHAVASTSTPSRYSLFTGHYAWRRNDTGIARGDAGMVIRPEQTTIADMFKSAGYTTGAIGKWHLGLGDKTGTQDWNKKVSPGPEDLGFDYSCLMAATGDVVVVLATVSMYCFLAARCILALGEAGNFPAAIKVTAEYFPKKDRAYATSIFNAGASIGALIAPLTIPILAKAFGWEMAFIVIGGLGFIWMGFWVFMYDAPSKSKHVNKAELEYIEQDQNEAGAGPKTEEKDEKKMRFWQCFSYKQTWAFVFGKFTTDGVWWFFLFWTPSYLNSQFGIKTSDPLGMGLIFTLYAITMLSIYGGKLPTIFINKTGMNPYAARMKAMLIFAFFPLVVLLAQPLGTFSPWFPVILIGIGGAAHQSWSANIFSTVGDMFPRTAIASITGIGGMAGGIGSMILQKVAGNLFVYASGTTMVDGKEVEMTKELLEQGAQFVHPAMTFMGFEGKPAGYFVIFCVCAVAYLIGWVIMKALVPKYKPIVLD